LVDRFDPASGKMAKAIRRSSSNSPAACDGISVMIAAILFEVRLSFIVLVAVMGSALSASSAPETLASSALSPRTQVTIENWDKGGALSHWVYTHMSEMFPVAVIERGGAIVDLPTELKPEIGGLKLNKPGEPEQTLDQFVGNGAVDGCIVRHGGKIVYEKYPTIRPNDIHIMMSITKAFVLTALAILEDRGKVDLEKPVEQFLPELKGERLGRDAVA
jgi:CubicO group peptidase (beta-lactamase class C family)